jgi:HlyD family secretion protein
MTPPAFPRLFHRRPRTVLAGAAAALVLLLLWLAGRSRPQAADSGMLAVPVVRGPLTVSVKASGEIKSVQPNKVIPKLRRSANITFLLPEGSRVTNGQLVVQFNTEELLREIQRAESGVVDALSRRDTARADLEVQRMDNLTAERKAEQDVQTAQMELEKFLQGDEPTERRNAEIKVQNAEGEYLRKKTRHDQYVELFAQGFVTETEVQEARLAMQTALVAHETARIERSLLADYTHTLKITGLEAALDRANTELEKVQVQNTSRLRAREQNLTLAELTLSRAEEDLARLRRDLEDYDVKATFDSVVNYGDPDQFWRRGEIQVGSTFHPGQVLMSLPDMSEMQAVVNAAEVDVHRVTTGLTALVRIEAVQGQVFTGRVSQVAEVANNEGFLKDDVRQFKVTISLPENARLKPGFSCEAEILCDYAPSVLLLPVQAVFRDGGRMVVYPAAGPAGARIEVKTGRASLHHVEILDGLREGDRVRLTPTGGAGP